MQQWMCRMYRKAKSRASQIISIIFRQQIQEKILKKFIGIAIFMKVQMVVLSTNVIA